MRRDITEKKRTTARIIDVQMYVCLMVTSWIGVGTCPWVSLTAAGAEVTC